MECFRLTHCVSLNSKVIRYQYNQFTMLNQKLTQNLHTSKMGVRMVDIQC